MKVSKKDWYVLLLRLKHTHTHNQLTSIIREDKHCTHLNYFLITDNDNDGERVVFLLSIYFTREASVRVCISVYLSIFVSVSVCVFLCFWWKCFLHTYICHLKLIALMSLGRVYVCVCVFYSSNVRINFPRFFFC